MADKIPLNEFMSILRSITPDQKEMLFPFVSKVTESYLNKETLDHDAFTGYQNKFFSNHADFFKRLSAISERPAFVRSLLGKKSFSTISFKLTFKLGKNS